MNALPNTIDPSIRQHAKDLLNFIDSSPSPWHAAAAVEHVIQGQGFSQLNEGETWRLQAGGRYYVVRDGSSIILFVCGKSKLPKTGFRVVGAHTDSPGLRVKPQAAFQTGKLIRLGVEIYGGPILATFTDRDLSLAGRVCLRNQNSSTAIDTPLIHFKTPIVRLPNLAIHMNRKVNDEGLRLHKQNELPLIFSISENKQPAQQQFLLLLADKLECNPDDILTWELNVFDTQKGAFFGQHQEFIADSQLDNLASCHAALTAILTESGLNAESTALCAFFDHEEIGSESLKGAGGSFLSDVLERVAIGLDIDVEGYKQALSNSFLISADMAHAYHPNFPSAYEPNHQALVNSGPVIKINANQRYTSEPVSEAMFIKLCEQAGAPWQKYTHRTDIPCGSTIGPMTSARLGMRSVDVGNPMWAMHSARESAGVLDHSWMTEVLANFFSS